MVDVNSIELKQGQKGFEIVLVAWEDVKGKKKSDNSNFHFCKISLDLTLEKRDGTKYSKIQEFMCEPEMIANLNLQKYKPVYAIFEMTSPIHTPKLVKIVVLE